MTHSVRKSPIEAAICQILHSSRDERYAQRQQILHQKNISTTLRRTLKSGISGVNVELFSELKEAFLTELNAEAEVRYLLSYIYFR
jgi:hypothetical protein